MELAAAGGRSGSFCPSEAARQVFGADWGAQAERTRRAVRRLAVSGRVRILQRGREVDPSEFRGPIRVQLA